MWHLLEISGSRTDASSELHIFQLSGELHGLESNTANGWNQEAFIINGRRANFTHLSRADSQAHEVFLDYGLAVKLVQPCQHHVVRWRY